MDSRSTGEQGDELDMDVLVVVVNPGLRRYIVDVLKTVGYRVAEAENGFEALRQIRSSNIGTIVLDSAMSGYDGFDLLAKMESTGSPRVVTLGTERPGVAPRTCPVVAALDYPMKIAALALVVTTALEDRGWRPPLVHQA